MSNRHSTHIERLAGYVPEGAEYRVSCTCGWSKPWTALSLRAKFQAWWHMKHPPTFKNDGKARK